MKFSDDSSGKRYHFKKLSQARKYIFMKKGAVNEKSMAQMKHKPYSCDFKNEKQRNIEEGSRHEGM